MQHYDVLSLWCDLVWCVARVWRDAKRLCMYIYKLWCLGPSSSSSSSMHERVKSCHACCAWLCRWLFLVMKIGAMRCDAMRFVLGDRAVRVPYVVVGVIVVPSVDDRVTDRFTHSRNSLIETIRSWWAVVWCGVPHNSRMHHMHPCIHSCIHSYRTVPYSVLIN